MYYLNLDMYISSKYIIPLTRRQPLRTRQSPRLFTHLKYLIYDDHLIKRIIENYPCSWSGLLSSMFLQTFYKDMSQITM